MVAPAAGAALAAGSDAAFEGSAYALQEGWLTDPSRLVWTSSRDGDLGTGRQVDAGHLSAGEHDITLTVTDSDGATATAPTEKIRSSRKSGENVAPAFVVFQRPPVACPR